MIVVAVAACLCLTSSVAADVPQFADWARHYGRRYDSAAALAAAQGSYTRNAERIHSLSRHSRTARFGVNALSDLPDVLLDQRRGLKAFPGASTMQSKTFTSEEISTALDAGRVDWHLGPNPKNLSAVTRVKNQALCGSCYAFATVATIESISFINGHDLRAFSEQSMVDCYQSQYLNGCNGGNVGLLLEAVANKLIPMEKDYEYISYAGGSEKCKLSEVPGIGKITGGYQVHPQNSEDAMAAWVYFVGPLAVGVQSKGTGWDQYQSGILDTCGDQTDVDHAVTIVGYGELDGKKYWKIKNSWSPMWGEQGYILLPRGENACGVATMPFGPNVPLK